MQWSPVRAPILSPVVSREVELPSDLRDDLGVVGSNEGRLAEHEPLRAVFLTALPVEHKAIRVHLVDLDERVDPHGTVYEVGQFQSTSGSPWEVAIGETGSGNDVAALAASRAVDYFSPQLVAFVGVAGGLKDVSLGDVVIADYIYGYESGKELEDFRPRTKTQSSSFALVQRARLVAVKEFWKSRLRAEETCPHKALVGTLAAGEKVVASRRSPTFLFLAENCSDALAVEMEGWGFLLGSNDTTLAIVIRGISDCIDGKTSVADEGTQPIAADHAAAFAFELLATWRSPDDGPGVGDPLQPASSDKATVAASVQQSVHSLDFVIIHMSTDRAWAEWLAWQLHESGYQVVQEVWDASSRSDVRDEILARAERKPRVLAVISQASSGTLFPSSEPTLTSLTRPSSDLVNKGAIPVRVDNVDQSSLGAPLSIDLVGLDEERARVVLLEGVRRQRANAIVAPPFPVRAASAASARPRFPQALPPIWNVPRVRNADFKGREGLLSELRANLAWRETTVLSQAIIGQGGVGKTELAAEYAYRYRSDYDLVWWVRAEHPATLTTDFGALAFPLGLSPNLEADQALAVGAVRRELEARNRWLLVFDNAPDRESLIDFIPTGGGGHVLITSRSRAWSGGETVLPVDVLSEDEATSFLMARTGETDETGLRALATELGCLPLALDQASAYVAQSPNLSIADYRQVLHARAAEWLSNGHTADYSQTVASIWSLSIESVREASEAAAQILSLVAFLGPDDIPIGLLIQTADLIPEPLSTVASDPIGFEDAIALLGRFALVNVGGDALAVHRLVQLVVRGALEAQEREFWAAIAVAVVERGLANGNTADPWAAVIRVLPHAIAALTNALAAGVDVGKLDELADRLTRLGSELREYGDLSGARAAAESALGVHRDLHGDDDPRVGIDLNNLGLVLRDQGHPGDAKACFERSIEIGEATDGPDSTVVGVALNNLGIVLRDRGDLGEARKVAERALRIHEAALGATDRRVGADLSNLSRVLRDLGDLVAAKQSSDRALTILEATLGSDHAWVGRALTHRSILLRDLKDLDGARSTAERALSVHERACGLDHPWVGSDLRNLGLILRDQGELVPAKDCFGRALTIHRAAYGPENFHVAHDLEELGQVLADLGDIVGAEDCRDSAAAIRQVGDSRADPKPDEGLTHLPMSPRGDSS